MNRWVHSRTPEADFEFDHAPRANESVALTSTSRHPEGAAYFTTFRWDFDNDGTFETDSTPSKSVPHVFTAPGQAVVGLEASKPGGDKASVYYAFDVGADPNAPAPVVTPPAADSTTPPPAVTKPTVRLATILNARRPKVSKKGRFKIRVSFTASAPAGTAVVEVFRGKRKVGTAKGLRPPRRLASDDDQAEQDGPEAAQAQQDQAPEGHGAGPRGQDDPAHEDDHDPALGTTGSRGTARAPRA